MAEISTIARPYAEALFQVAKSSDLTQWAARIDTLAFIAIQSDVARVLNHPGFSSAQLFNVFAAGYSGVLGAMDESVANFVWALIENHRLSLLPEIARQFGVLLDAHRGIAEAEITSAFPLEENELLSLVQGLERKFAIKLRPKVFVDQSLIGGVRVKVGDQVLDTSVVAKLEQMSVALVA